MSPFWTAENGESGGWGALLRLGLVGDDGGSEGVKEVVEEMVAERGREGVGDGEGGCELAVDGAISERPVHGLGHCRQCDVRLLLFVDRRFNEP